MLSHRPQIPTIPLQHREPHVTASLAAQKAECSTQTGAAATLQTDLTLRFDLQIDTGFAANPRKKIFYNKIKKPLFFFLWNLYSRIR